MNSEIFKIETKGNGLVSVSKISPKTPNKKSIVISSATGVLQKYYSKFAAHFCSLGFTVYSFDYSGIGDSNSKKIKQNTSNLSDWANNQALVLEFAKQQNSNYKITLITHSIGGQLIGLNSKIHLVDAIVMVCSQTGYWKHFKGFSRYRMLLFWYALIPITTPLFGYFPAKKIGLFENLPKHVVYQWRKWGIHPEYMFSQFNDLRFSTISCKVLSLSFPRDKYAPKDSVDWLASKFTNTKVDRRHLIPEDLQIEDVQHFGFFREKFKDSLWQLTEDWIDSN